MSNNQFTEDQLAKLKKAFDLIDKDGNGSITVKELGDALKPFGQNPSAKEVPEIINELDANGNGTMEFDEFVTLMQRDGLSNYKFELGDIFRVTDKNGNSYINKEELRQAMANMGQTVSDKELDAMIKGAGGSSK
ncbi:translation elongation factor EF1B gamma [Coemansia sp. BCRC 34301]|nr:translation elongation factor EF1B gamma [Coemansia sp. BCRC 34301]